MDRGLDAVCAQFIRCASDWGPVYPEVATCKTLLAPEVPPAIDQSRLDVSAIDGTAFDECIQQGTSACVPSGPSLVRHCLEGALVGSLAEGACCDARGGCESGLVCEPGSAGLGLCRPVVGQGASCAEAVCGEGLTCASSRLCVRLPSVGETCLASSPRCAERLYCGTTGLCAAYPGAGESCRDTLRCADGLGCDFFQGYVCVASTGPACDLLTGCPDGSYCDFSRLECAPAAPLGAECASDDACTPGAACVTEAAAGSCVARALLGETCDASSVSAPPCAAGYGLVCKGGKCQAAPTLGQACTPGEACAPLGDAWCDGTSGTCAARIEVGQPCAADAAGAEPCVLGATCDPDLEACLPRPIATDGGERCP